MSDFDDVFGADANVESITWGYSGSMLGDMDNDSYQWYRFVEIMLFRAKLIHSNFTMYLPTYDDVKIFDRNSRCDADGSYDFSFQRKRESSGYRVTASASEMLALFPSKGFVVIVRSPSEAIMYAKTSHAVIFEVKQEVGDYRGLTKISSTYLNHSEKKEASRDIFQQLDRDELRHDVSVFDILDMGGEVVVCGRGRAAAFELKSLFKVWTPEHGLVSPAGWGEYRDLLDPPPPEF